MPRDAWIPPTAEMLGWIEQVVAQGVRRSGTPADRWAEQFALDHFQRLGLEDVRLEPVPVPWWEPRAWSLRVETPAAREEIACFPLPFCCPTPELTLELAAFDPSAPAAVSGKAALHDVRLLRLPPAFPATGGAAAAELEARSGLGLRAEGRVLDPERSFDGAVQVMPFAPEIMAVMEPAMAAGARAFVGCLRDYPGDSCSYYVPYDGVAREMPGLWIRGSDGARLRRLLDVGPVRVTIAIDAERGMTTCHNVVGELPGADEEIVVVGSHHDAPWASAVEDGSGIALVLAQAAYWARVPRAERPHRMLFLLNAAHMAGGAGCAGFLAQHAAELGRIVLELHLEHAAREIVEQDGTLAPTGLPEPRWWFTSRIPALEDAVVEALRAERLDRSLVLPPDALGPHPTTDAGFFHLEGVPLVNYLTAPFYLFDEMDRMDKVHPESLVPVTRAAIRILEWTRGQSAAGMRAAVVGGAA